MYSIYFRFPVSLHSRDPPPPPYIFCSCLKKDNGDEAASEVVVVVPIRISRMKKTGAPDEEDRDWWDVMGDFLLVLPPG